ncbi:MAG: hypothetical protein ACFCVH_16010 [Alphaproteobacteria bacterium]
MSEIDELRARVVRAEERARRAEERAAMLKIEVERLRGTAAAPAGAGADRFAAVKRAFARLYHPDQRSGSRIEAVVRTEVFNEFWPEIEQIERQVDPASPTQA